MKLIFSFIAALALPAVSSANNIPTYGICTIISGNLNQPSDSGYQLSPDHYLNLISPLPSWLQKKFDESSLSSSDLEIIMARESDFKFEITRQPKNGKIFDHSYVEDGFKRTNMHYVQNSGFTGEDSVGISVIGISQQELRMNLKYYIHVLGNSQKTEWHKILTNTSERGMKEYTKFVENLCGKGHSTYWLISPKPNSKS